jgi:mannitol/fructose-specific phosphotransferase system IIA component (Ntr-type)
VQNSWSLTSEPSLNSANCADTGLVDVSSLVDAAVLVPRLQADTKIGAIKELVNRLYHEGAVSDSLRFLQAVLERDDLQSTVIGESIALPHARCTAATRLGIAVGLAPERISYPSGDDCHDVQTIVLVAVPANAADSYLSLLGALATALDSDAVVDHLRNATTSDDIIKLFSNASIVPPSLPQKG